MTRESSGASNRDWRRATEDLTIVAYVPSERIGTDGADGSTENRELRVAEVIPAVRTVLL
jgi:hypothetical protein